MDDRQVTGIKGEEIAARFLKEKGYTILERNWRFRHKEVDIIARDGNYLVIVEVKTLKSPISGDPVDGVSIRKQRLLIDAAEIYLNYRNLDLEVRFDVVSIILSGRRTQVEHIVEAFHPLAG